MQIPSAHGSRLSRALQADRFRGGAVKSSFLAVKFLAVKAAVLAELAKREKAKLNPGFCGSFDFYVLFDF
jgi:hypothetical protein